MTDLIYQARGASAKKEEIYEAINHVERGIFPAAFCKIVEDFLGKDPQYCNVMPADGAGTKSALAYLYYQETGDLSVFEGIVQDALVMNIDDLLCVGVYDDLLLSSTIGRNAKRISGEVLKTLIEGHEKFVAQMAQWGISLLTTGGETADLGDLVRTLVVDATVTARWPRNKIITNEKIQPGNLIIGLASFGETTYESQYNSGMGSNGLTSARHDLLHTDYAQQFPESYDPQIADDLVYRGPFHLSDALEGTPLTIGQALLSSTRTYAPILKELLSHHFDLVSGVIHCSGGGQTECVKFGSEICYIKDHLFPVPPLFQTIQEVSQTPWSEMYQVFNMGHRMEIIGPPELLPVVQEIGQKYQLEVQQIGRCEESSEKHQNQLQIISEFGIFEFA